MRPPAHLRELYLARLIQLPPVEQQAHFDELARLLSDVDIEEVGVDVYDNIYVTTALRVLGIEVQGS